MESKLLLVFFMVIEVGILVLCETDSFVGRHNENLSPGDLDLSKRKDFYIFERNDLGAKMKNVNKRPTVMNEQYSQLDTSFENHQETTKTNFSEKESFQQDGYNKWENEKSRFLYPNRQESQQDTFVGHALERRIQPINRWDWGGKFFQNSQSRWNEENFNKHNTGLGVKNEKYDAVVPNPDIGKINVIGEPLIKNMEMNGYFQAKNVVPENKVSLTLLDDQVKSVNYDHEIVKNPFKGQFDSNLNYYYNRNGFRNFHQPEKGVVINFNTECSTSKPFSNPVFPKFILAPKPRIPQTEVPAFQIPEATVITRQMSTPLYYL